LVVKPDPKSINQAIQAATPEQMLKLKKAEQDFELHMKELEVDVFKLEVQDKQDARGKFSRDWTATNYGYCCCWWVYGLHIFSYFTATRTKL
jgi:hypothetical protein